jgi:hypothetical protein
MGAAKPVVLLRGLVVVVRGRPLPEPAAAPPPRRSSLVSTRGAVSVALAAAPLLPEVPLPEVPTPLAGRATVPSSGGAVSGISSPAASFCGVSIRLRMRTVSLNWRGTRFSLVFR